MMCFHRRGRFWAKLASTLVLLTCPASVPRLLVAATYHVDPAVASAADSNAGTETAPWKTVSRAASAEELQPGDTVMIHSGVYREHVEVKVDTALRGNAALRIQVVGQRHRRDS